MSGELYALRGLYDAIRRCLPKPNPRRPAATRPCQRPGSLASRQQKQSARMTTCSCDSPYSCDNTAAATPSAKRRGKRPIDNCAICLDELGTEGPTQMLACGHAYCRPCVGKHVKTIIAEGRWPGCPLCTRPLGTAEAEACCPGATVATGGAADWQPWRPWRRGAAGSGGSSGPSSSAAAVVLTDAEVQALGLRRCPRCRTPIEKNGGCDNMRCRCGCRFKWSDPTGRRAALLPAHLPAPRFVGTVAVITVGLPLAWAAGFVATGLALLIGCAGCLSGRFGWPRQVATALSLAALGSLGWLPMVAIAAMQIGGGVAVLGALVCACMVVDRF